MMRGALRITAVALVAATSLAACSGPVDSARVAPPAATTRASVETPPPPPRVVTLAFAGDMHFQLHLAALLDDPRGLGPVRAALASADVAMVNLESAVTERGTLDPKDLETPGDRYWYRAPATALRFLADAGVDVVTVANNHGADYGPEGLRDTVRAAHDSPVAVIGVGADREHAFAGHRVTVHGTELAFLAADASPLESTSGVWSAGRRTPGLAAAHDARPRALLAAVREADRAVDVVVVYLHWGEEGRACPTALQRTTAQALSAAGADVIVGSHAHVLLGSGWLDDTYVDYGLGNFLWYHNGEPDTGVLRLRIVDGQVVDDAWVPAEIELWGRPMPVLGSARDRAVADWRELRGCTDLAADPDGGPVGVESSVQRIGPALRTRMRSTAGPRCPVAWRDLRLLRVTHVGFDGRDHVGRLVVAASYARPVLGVLETLYDARWPIRRMRTVDAYDGSDARSMAADNSSGYNCRRVQDSDAWSAHAYGTAIDLNPVRNPYLTAAGVSPRAGRRYAAIDRSPGADVPAGTIRADDLVVRAFAGIGWEWGGTWATPDYQHFAATGRPR